MPRARPGWCRSPPCVLPRRRRRRQGRWRRGVPSESGLVRRASAACGGRGSASGAPGRRRLAHQRRTDARPRSHRPPPPAQLEAREGAATLCRRTRMPSAAGVRRNRSHRRRTPDLPPTKRQRGQRKPAGLAAGARYSGACCTRRHADCSNRSPLKPPMTTISSRSGAAATSVRGAKSGEPATQTAAMRRASRLKPTPGSDRTPNQPTSRTSDCALESGAVLLSPLVAAEEHEPVENVKNLSGDVRWMGTVAA